MKYIMHTPPISERDAKTWTRGPLKNEVKRGDLYYNVDGCGPSRTSWEQHVDGYLESRAERACMHFTVAGYPVYAAPSECLRYCALTSNWESMRVPEQAHKVIGGHVGAKRTMSEQLEWALLSYGVGGRDSGAATSTVSMDAVEVACNPKGDGRCGWTAILAATLGDPGLAGELSANDNFCRQWLPYAVR